MLLADGVPRQNGAGSGPARDYPSISVSFTPGLPGLWSPNRWAVEAEPANSAATACSASCAFARPRSLAGNSVRLVCQS
jgi:hypothetical protein